MDAKLKAKEVFRSKLREATRARDKRIDSPLVRYNEFDQPVCKVCNVALKSDSLWSAHQVSRKHHEAVEKVRSSATGLQTGKDRRVMTPADLPQKRSGSAVPSDFYDKQEPKKQKSVNAANYKTSGNSDFHDYQISRGEVSAYVFSPEGIAEKVNVVVEEHDPAVEVSKEPDELETKNTKGVIGSRNEKEAQEPYEFHQPHKIANISEGNHGHDASFVAIHGLNEHNNVFLSNQSNLPPRRTNGTHVPQVRGALPEGFFDNKDADLRARGIEPVKVDIVDAYKEFEREIVEHLQEVDDRLEEDEIDAAVVSLEEFEALEQNQKREQADMMKKKVMEMKAMRNSRLAENSKRQRKESSETASEREDEDEDEDEDDFAMADWRAQHL